MNLITLGIFSTIIGLVYCSSLESQENDERNLIHSNETVKDNDDMKNNIVSLMNCYRSCHHVKAVTRVTSIERQSDSWANTLAQSGQLEHSQSGYGENLYAGPLRSAKDPVNAWYFECQGSYNYNSESNSFNCGHFTQLVWKKSTNVGIGIATSSNWGYIVVTNWDPPGNYQGEYVQNVLSPDESCVQSCNS